jgi:hypothetical protein
VAEQFVEFLCKNRLHWGAIAATMGMSTIFRDTGSALTNIVSAPAGPSMVEAAPVCNAVLLYSSLFKFINHEGIYG